MVIYEVLEMATFVTVRNFHCISDKHKLYFMDSTSGIWAQNWITEVFDY
jgi:hypothetical protein